MLVLQRGRLVHVQDMTAMHSRRVHVRFAQAPAAWPDFLTPWWAARARYCASSSIS